ncbi:hypothetical protein EPN28_01405 [Patescibacteria group bacterium]|nr:MAG: hypothetical protein EPN28_01405 [Patescibacteria group bacterium]
MLKLKIFFLPFLAIIFFGGAGAARALDFTPPPFRDPSYGAKYVGQSAADPIAMNAGESKTVTVKFKNTGQTAWPASGKNYVSVYTIAPNYRPSLFTGQGWPAESQAAKVTAAVSSGKIGEFKIKLTAPKTAGEYIERFNLAAENKTWIKGGYFYLKVKVTANARASGNSARVDDEAAQINKEYRAHLLTFSARSVQAKGGEPIFFKVRYINDGTAAWKNYLWQEAGSSAGKIAVASAAGGRVAIADTSWLSAAKIKTEEKTVAPNEPLDIEYSFRAPVKIGEYAARFQLTANNHTLDGGTLELPVTVTADAPVDYQEPVFTSTRRLISEPNIRVGLYKADKEVKFLSDFPYQVYSGEVLMGTLFAQAPATLSYAGGAYTFASADLNFSASQPVRFVPDDIKYYFTLVNYDRRAAWKGNKNFNVYRGAMEFKYSPKSDAPFVINELPLDLYVAGIAETSNGAAMEYIKALLVAARTYAYYQINNGVPADKRTYDVVATTADQLYLGYNSEALMPRVVQAAQATYGEMVTYNAAPVITPYFGHSDGRTRAWTEVWGGSAKPWLVGVEAKYDAGQKMWGHGVGMSAQDASQRADKDGWTYDQILQYYYTGTETEKIY